MLFFELLGIVEGARPCKNAVKLVSPSQSKYISQFKFGTRVTIHFPCIRQTSSADIHSNCIKSTLCEYPREKALAASSIKKAPPASQPIFLHHRLNKCSIQPRPFSNVIQC